MLRGSAALLAGGMFAARSRRFLIEARKQERLQARTFRLSASAIGIIAYTAVYRM
jgi:hypothetical protein